ncbi:MAG: NADPH:quinone oxidoreductase family protein [Roseovarius sp.]
MRGFLIEEYGAPGSHSIHDIPDLAPGADEILIQNHAIGLNYPDALMVQGKYQKRPTPPFPPGRDCAGVVLAVGSDITDFKAGDPVVAQVFSGAFSEQVLAPRSRVFHRPEAVSSVDAAGAITVFNTAYVAVSIRAGVKAGDRVVVTGAAGGVGLAAVQLAHALGAHVLGIVSSEEKAQMVRACGADALVITERDEDALKQAFKDKVRAHWGDDKGADVVVDTVGGAMFIAGLRALGFAGRMVIVGFASGDIPSAKANYLLYNNLTVMGAPLDIHFDFAREQIREGTEFWLGLLAEGRVKANVSKVLPFEQLMTGLQDILDRKVAGKLAVEVKAEG